MSHREHGQNASETLDTKTGEYKKRVCVQDFSKFKSLNLAFSFDFDSRCHWISAVPVLGLNEVHEKDAEQGGSEARQGKRAIQTVNFPRSHLSVGFVRRLHYHWMAISVPLVYIRSLRVSCVSYHADVHMRFTFRFILYAAAAVQLSARSQMCVCVCVHFIHFFSSGSFKIFVSKRNKCSQMNRTSWEMELTLLIATMTHTPTHHTVMQRRTHTHTQTQTCTMKRNALKVFQRIHSRLKDEWFPVSNINNSASYRCVWSRNFFVHSSVYPLPPFDVSLSLHLLNAHLPFGFTPVCDSLP